ncbi:M16 family metallopeptidase [Sphingomonas bacterium]|uniref:M16 family metallopeptidase n=1 Tax=Sphingomonas bacterium TaxID=1895847 RepID=UPI001575AC6B|nr:M16 family metallopeptidase [Sphingomonas bacterium]
MTFLPRMLIVLLLALPGAGFARIPPKRPGVWAQSYVDRAPDPAIRFGRLPNGLRYAIRRNGTPAAQISLRLYIGSGSLAEPKGSEGLAHFLEHMAFRGSTHVADGDAMRMLARQGLAIGADANASTSPEATIYAFDFPQGGKPAIDTGLMLFREIATNLTIGDKSVDAERGAILGEERLRDGPALHAGKAGLAFLLAGQIAPDRLPIGHIDVIQHAPAGLIRAFYELHYRPENAAIVAVGDLDPDAIEAEIKARFSDWQGKGPSPPPPALGSPAPRGEEVRLFSEPGAPTQAQISWVRPFDDRADTSDREREDYDRIVGLLAINQRLSDIARRTNAPFLNAGVQRSNVLGSAEVTNFGINPLSGAPLPSVRAAVDEQARALRFGLTQPEVDRAVQALTTILSNAAAGADSRTSQVIANAIVRDIGSNEVTRSPAQDLADLQEWNRFLSLRNVNAALKRAFAGSGPLIFLSTAQPLPGGEAALRAAFDQAGKGLVAPAATGDAPGWPYTGFGKPGTVAQKREIGDLGITIVTFANGVTLAIKPQKVTANEVLVSASFGQGRLGLPVGKAQSYWMVGQPTIFVEGGTGKLSAGEMQRVLTGKTIGVGLRMDDDAFALQGRTNPTDLPTELQLLTAYLSDPGFRPEAVTRAQNALGLALPQIDSTPTGVARRELPVLLHSGDARWMALPTADQLAQSRPQDLIGLLDPALQGAVAVTIVGDVTVDQAIAAVASTFGALPPRPPRIEPQPRDVRFPAPAAAPYMLQHSGRGDQGIAYQAWGTDGYFANPDDARALAVAAAAMKQRLFDQLREAQGATYSPDVSAPASNALPHYGLLAAEVEIAPDKAPAFYALVDTIAADLRTRPLSADELDRAKRPQIDARKRELQTNPFWLGVIALGQRDPRAFDAARELVSGMEKVSAADVQRAAAKYLLPGRAYRALVKARTAP